MSERQPILRWCVVANVADSGNTALRENAHVAITNFGQGLRGHRSRVEVQGLSFGGRTIKHWIAIRQLRDVRVVRKLMAPRLGFDTRDLAQGWADTIVRLCKKGPLPIVRLAADIKRLTVVPVRLKPDLDGVFSYTDGHVTLDPGPTDDQQVIRFMIDGLIKRDCEAPSPAAWAAWIATPEGQAELAKVELRKSGELRFVSLTERHADGDGFSLKYVEVDREALRRLMNDGWQFDVEFTAWGWEIDGTEAMMTNLAEAFHPHSRDRDRS
jgi:hypothetical protein